MSLTKSLSFLSALTSNNNREWFNDHKSQFLDSQQEVRVFAEGLHEKMSEHDHLEDWKKIFRLYRDVRFSNDKTPYKTYWSGSFRRATDQLRGGYYFSIQPGNSYVAGGFFGPNAQDLLHIRKQIAQDPAQLRSVLDNQKFRETFGQLIGEQVKTAPKGFLKDDPAIDLIRYKQFIVEHRFSDEQVLADDFTETASAVFRQMRPYLDYMSDILTTDLNGSSLI